MKWVEVNRHQETENEVAYNVEVIGNGSRYVVVWRNPLTRYECT